MIKIYVDIIVRLIKWVRDLWTEEGSAPQVHHIVIETLRIAVQDEKNGDANHKARVRSCDGFEEEYPVKFVAIEIKKARAFEQNQEINELVNEILVDKDLKEKPRTYSYDRGASGCVESIVLKLYAWYIVFSELYHRKELS